jgi:hypothetical protein
MLNGGVKLRAGAALMPQAGQLGAGAVRDPRQHLRERSVLIIRAQPAGEIEG